MRSEDDLRTALTSLEEQAPVAARVLPGLSTPRSRGGLRSPLTLRWVAGVAATAAVVGAVVGLTVSNGTPSTIPNGGVASAQLPAKATLQAKLLAAVTAASGEIFYEHTTIDGHYSIDDSYYPLQPTAGQQVRNLMAFYAANGTLTYNLESTYTMPQATSDHPASSTVGETATIAYNSRTWSAEKDATLGVGLPNPQDDVTIYAGKLAAFRISPGQLDQQNIIDSIKSGQWKAVSYTLLNGQNSIKLSLPQGNGATTYLWVGAQSYLPLREETTPSNALNGKSTVLQTDFELLPPTSANLAKLTPPIPAGFKRVASMNVLIPSSASASSK